MATLPALNVGFEEAMRRPGVDPVYQAIDARIRMHSARLGEILARPLPVSTPDGLVWAEEEAAVAACEAKFGGKS